MRLLLGLLLLTATTAFAAEPTPPPQPAPLVREPALGELTPLCADSARVLLGQPALADRSLSAKVHPLIDEPSANMELTVQRSIDGCPAPVVVRYDIDGSEPIPEQLR